MSASRNKKNYRIAVTVALIIAVVCGMVAVLMTLFATKEETITGGTTTTSISSLYCSSKISRESYFVPTTENGFLHEIKVTLSEDKPTQISYTYSGTFDSQELAEKANAGYHFAYGEYMGKSGLTMSYLGPSFSVIDNKLIINLSADNEKFNSDTATIFSLDGSKKLEYYSHRTLEDIYKKSGYTCKYSD